MKLMVSTLTSLKQIEEKGNLGWFIDKVSEYSKHFDEVHLLTLDEEDYSAKIPGVEHFPMMRNRAARFLRNIPILSNIFIPLVFSGIIANYARKNEIHAARILGLHTAYVFSKAKGILSRMGFDFHYFVSLQGDELFYYKGLSRWFLFRMFRRGAENADMIIPICKYLGDKAEKLYGVKSGPVVLDMISPNRFRRKKLDKEKLLSKYGLEIHGDEPVIVFTGRLVELKGLQILFQAIDRMEDRYARYLIIGSGEYEDELKRMGDEMRLERVHFLGTLKSDEIEDILSVADVFVLPSFTEGISISLLEAMMCGVPVVATSAGGNPEVVGNAGIQVPSGKPLPLAMALDRVISNKKLSGEMSKRGLERVKMFHTDKVIANEAKIMKKFLEAAEGPKGR